MDISIKKIIWIISVLLIIDVIGSIYYEF